ncbi:MAG: ethylbenzene dehydrogenase-related protein, partial [Promethearchaeota archaeon]
MKNKKFSIILLAIVGLSIILFVSRISLVGAQSADLIAPEVTGAITVDGEDNEAFWADATSQTFTTTKTTSPTADVPADQQSVEVKAVITTTEIRVFFKWKDLTASNTGVGNEDRLALMILSTDANPMAAPCMLIGSNGATTSGTVDQWHWKAGRTDSDGAKYGAVGRGGILFNLTSGNATYTSLESDKSWFNFTETPLPNGNPQIGDVVYTNGSSGSFVIANATGVGTVTKLDLTAHSHSFAENEYIDTTSRKRSGDSEYTAFGILPSSLSGEDRYHITAKGSRATADHWTLEMVRTLAVSNPTVDRPMASGETVKFAVGVYEGGVGHDHDEKYITSAWKTLHLGP